MKNFVKTLCSLLWTQYILLPIHKNMIYFSKQSNQWGYIRLALFIGIQICNRVPGSFANEKVLFLQLVTEVDWLRLNTWSKTAGIQPFMCSLKQLLIENRPAYASKFTWLRISLPAHAGKLTSMCW